MYLVIDYSYRRTIKLITKGHYTGEDVSEEAPKGGVRVSYHWKVKKGLKDLPS